MSNRNRYAVTVEVEASSEQDAIELVRDPSSGEFEPVGDNPRAHLVDEELAGNRPITTEGFGRLLHHAAEQANKNQWWNVIATLHQATALALRRFDHALNSGRSDTH
jgi:hypothetical protein